MNIADIASILIERSQNSGRIIVAVAGAPTSGKSTLCAKLSISLNDQATPSAVVTMDGFHMDNGELDVRGWRELKGAPQTFDSRGLVNLIASIHANKKPIRVPDFDRAKDAVVAGRTIVDRNHQIILVEGNYVLLNEEPWSELANYFDFSILLNPTLEEIETRSIKRWLENGRSWSDARQRAQHNDVPNGIYVVENSRKADLILEEVILN